ncbi:hypothetical protein COU18_01520 [Candidatus Kaiserbacteria bacterium CG10_big_fil_rev_8_21_14_0_10_51_14]|uniref:Uncharacterized protein n=1 Tax=Candidatus Kaiserbacteria bacterium CG10_big_fil_rev_8_21_14_0_10_51_14 TaxID=1974610 RepID=A0A2H0UCF2_9BACT|nr:MAG: hypothetical protein COU18_01520 [Candidatus Kaiserbacteria bacterium CG10_big_fil_rev_8_21_14_0_10_51_14]
MSYPISNFRFFLVLIALSSALFAWWWIPLVCMIILSLRYSSWEVPILGLLIDVLWLPTEGISLPLFTILGIVLVWIFMPLRRQFLR